VGRQSATRFGSFWTPFWSQFGVDFGANLGSILKPYWGSGPEPSGAVFGVYFELLKNPKRFLGFLFDPFPSV
jgi:hypothetical protein